MSLVHMIQGAYATALMGFVVLIALHIWTDKGDGEE